MDTKTFSNLEVPFATEGSPFKNHTPDFYIPFFTLIELICYFGWIKVAETLLNPFGEDDEDFKINYQIDRNLQVINSALTNSCHILKIHRVPIVMMDMVEMLYHRKLMILIQFQGIIHDC